MEKTDLSKLFKSYYSAAQPEIIESEPAHYLSILGQGDPDGSDFRDKIEAIYPVAYAIKFHYKALGKDFVVPKLEGLWWFDETKYREVMMSKTPQEIPRNEWNYRLLIRMPDFVNPSDLLAIQPAISSKNKSPYIGYVEWFEMNEGLVVKALHTGPYTTESETLTKMMIFMSDNKLSKNGLHHEIYLSDFRKTAPGKLKTILREPVKRPQ